MQLSCNIRQSEVSSFTKVYCKSYRVSVKQFLTLFIFTFTVVHSRTAQVAGSALAQPDVRVKESNIARSCEILASKSSSV